MRNFRKLRSRRPSRLVESRRSRRRMIRESVEDKYGIPFWGTLDGDDVRESFNNFCDNMTVANFMKFPCKTSSAAKNSKTSTVYLKEDTLYNDVNDFCIYLADKYFTEDMYLDNIELITQTDRYNDFFEDLFKEYPNLKLANNESRRARNSSLTEAQAIRKIARIIAEAEDGQGDLFGNESSNKAFESDYRRLFSEYKKGVQSGGWGWLSKEIDAFSREWEVPGGGDDPDYVFYRYFMKRTDYTEYDLFTKYNEIRERLDSELDIESVAMNLYYAMDKNIRRWISNQYKKITNNPEGLFRFLETDPNLNEDWFPRTKTSAIFDYVLDYLYKDHSLQTSINAGVVFYSHPADRILPAFDPEGHIMYTCDPSSEIINKVTDKAAFSKSKGADIYLDLEDE